MTVDAAEPADRSRAGCLDGCAALVTGASSGIGLGIAEALAGEGATVALVARRRDSLAGVADRIEARGGRAVVVPADLAVPGEAARAVAEAAAALGRLDVVVNNAGVALPGPVFEQPEAEVAAMIDVNLTGLLAVSRAALPHLLEAAQQEPRRVADLVNIASVAGRRVPKGAGVYAATKAGVVFASEAMRQEVTDRHVRVGVVEPGAVAVDGLAERAARTAAVDEDRVRFDTFETLEVEDIAAAVVFMVSRPRRVAVNELLVRPTEQAT